MVINMKEIIIMVSVLIICILLIRRIFRGKIGSRFQYALWFLVVLRLIIPVSVPVHFSLDMIDQYHFLELNTDDMVEQLEKPIQVTISSQNRIYHLLAGDAAEMTDDVSGEAEGSSFFMVGHLRYSWLDVMGIIWTVGMVLIALWIFITNMIFSRRLKRGRRLMELSEEAEDVLQRKLPEKLLGMYKGVRIYIVEDLASPCLYGLLGREAVYLTPDVVNDADRLCHVLSHELCHKKHGDSFWGMLRGILVTVYWFHPLVWAAAILSKRDCELACDESALLFLGEDERIAYGETLLSIITRKARISDLVCTATTMTGNGRSVKERIGFIAKKPKVIGIAVALAAVFAAGVFVCAFTRNSERVRILVFGNEMVSATGADMLIPLPESIREVCGRVSEEENDDVIIYQISSRQEVGRFARMSLKDALQMVDAGREVVPLGDYGDNYLLKAYLGFPANVTMHTYTPARQDEGEDLGTAGGMLMHEEIYSESLDGINGVPGTDSNAGTEHVYEPGTESDTEAEHVYEPATDNIVGTEYLYESGTDSNTETEYVQLPDENLTTQIPAPEETDSYTFPLPFVEGQSLDAVEYMREDIQEDDTTYMLDEKVDYLPNEEITTTVYPPKEVNMDELHEGCYVYVKADYGRVKERYLEEMEQLNRDLKSVAEDVVVLSLNGEIREELFDDLTQNRTPYVGDSSKVGALVNALPVPTTLNYRGELSLQTVTEPYSLRFEYEMTQDSMLQDDMDMMYFNAAMLFYAIGNVDEITMYIKHPAGSVTPSSIQVYYRDDMEDVFSELAQADYENEQTFREGLEELHTKVIEHIHAQGQYINYKF